MALDRKNIRAALDASLKRLNTDYLDLYQLHWPQRQTNYFGKLGYQYSETTAQVTLLETLEALTEQVRAGKIRYIGVSNETAWGVMRYLQLAEKHELPRIISIQNPYSLLNRSFEVGLAEISQHEGVELLAYSSLAFGTLSGKYLNGAQPAGARNTLFSRFTRYSGEQSQRRLPNMWHWLSSIRLTRRRWPWPMCVSSRLWPARCWAPLRLNSCRSISTASI